MSQKFKSDIEAQAGIRDSSGAIGTSGQVLSSTGSNVSWINQTTVASDVQNQVKAGVAINKGQAVYVTGADGTNIIVGLASNTSEATSSKTLGLLNATVAVNGFADVVQIGRLAGLNTIGAVAGDPVWLGTNGNLIYGLIGKPYAPANLVFIGIVTRVNSNNGEIFVSVQNGFELNEIHDVDLKTTVPINGDVLGFNGTLWVNKTIAQWLGYTPANASGTTNYVSKFTGATTLGNSQIFDNGTNVGIGTATPSSLLEIAGSAPILTMNRTSGSFINTIDFKTGGSSVGSILSNAGNGEQRYSIGPSVGWGGYHTFYTDTSERMRITSSGNVGIGTTSPSSKLESYKGAQSDAITRASASAYFWGADVGLAIGQSASSPYGTWLQSLKYDTDVTFPLSLNPAGGNVGIGTTSPNYKLDVNGTVNIVGSFGNRGVDAAYRLKFYDNGGIANDAGIGLDGSPGGEQMWFNSLDGFYWSTGTNGEKMRITSGGNVGIGTTNPLYKFHVRTNTNGNIGFRNPSDFNSGWTTGSAFGVFNDADNANEKLYIETSQLGLNLTSQANTLIGGNVGIGTTSPSAFGGGGLTLGTSSLGKNLIINSSANGTNGLLQFVDLNGNNSLQIFGGSTEMNFYGYGNRPMSFYTNDAERMRITSGGNVGIGTTAPQAKLHINNGADRNLWFRVNGSGTGTELLSINDAQSTRQSLAFSASSFYFDSGNVGIGTTSPLDKLDVFGNQFLGDGTNTSQLYLRGVTGVSYAWTVKNLGTGYQVKSTSPGAGDGFNIDFSNRVGIGTTSPAYSLEVNGSINVYPNNFFRYDGDTGIIGSATSIGGASNQLGIRASNDILFATNGANERMRITSSGDVAIGTAAALLNTGGRGNITINGSYESILVLASGGVWKSYLFNDGVGNTYLTSAGVLNFGTNGSDRMRIDNSGNVGIGTTSPSQKLEVSGVIESPYLEYKPVVFYDFNSDTTGDWQKYNATLSTPSKSITRYTSTGADSSISRSFNFSGGQNQIIRIHYKVISGTPGTGEIFYANSQHGYSGSYFKGLELINDGNWHTLVLDMSQLSSGGTDWIDYNVLDIRFDLTNNVGVVIDLDWISIGGNGYGTQYFENDVAFMNGNVGIGTTSPGSNLTVVRDANNASYITTFSNTNAGTSAATISEWKVNGYSSFVIGKSNSDGRVEIAQIGNNNIDFINNGTNVMSIDTNQNVMVNGTTAEACAQLEIKSETKGFLPPRMSDADRDNISSPVEGLMIYNTTQKTINFYDGTTWQRVAVV